MKHCHFEGGGVNEIAAEWLSCHKPTLWIPGWLPNRKAATTLARTNGFAQFEQPVKDQVEILWVW